MALRAFANRKAGQFASSRARRTAYRRRTLLVANHWEGSVQQFYHFLLGYYLPVCAWVQRHPDAPITVRDCGPMNPWFDVLANHIDVEVIPPGGALHIVVGNRMAHEVLPGMDDPNRFDMPRLLAARNAMLRTLALRPCSTSKVHDRVIVIDRATSEDFYHSSESETHMSGAERRSVPNLRDVGQHVPPGTDLRILDLARIAPLDQVALVQEASILVGQHGAGLVHMIWMPPGSTVIEIAPPLPPEVIELFEVLAARLGHNYCRIPQESVHSRVDLDDVSRAIATALGVSEGTDKKR